MPAENVLTFTFTEVLLDNKTAVLAKGHDAVCLFVNDTCDRPVLETLHELGVVCCPDHHPLILRSYKGVRNISPCDVQATTM